MDRSADRAGDPFLKTQCQKPGSRAFQQCFPVFRIMQGFSVDLILPEIGFLILFQLIGQFPCLFHIHRQHMRKVGFAGFPFPDEACQICLPDLRSFQLPEPLFARFFFFLQLADRVLLFFLPSPVLLQGRL